MQLKSLILCAFPFSAVGCAGVYTRLYQNQLLSSLVQAGMQSGGIQPPEINSSGTKGADGGS